MQTADGKTGEQVDASLNGRAARSQSPGERSALTILKSIVEDLGMLIRMELRLAQQEIVAGLVARGVGVGALAVAGVMALFGMAFLAMAVTSALDLVMPAWASRLVVAFGFLAVAGAGALFARGRIKAVPMVPEETKRTIKEDVEWAKAQLGR
jgi:putative superfamily III holin-X